MLPFLTQGNFYASVIVGGEFCVRIFTTAEFQVHHFEKFELASCNGHTVVPVLTLIEMF